MSENHVTEERSCSVEDGRIIGRNRNKLIKLGERSAIILHNDSYGFGGARHTVALDFRSDPDTADGPASEECKEIILQYFPELSGP